MQRTLNMIRCYQYKPYMVTARLTIRHKDGYIAEADWMNFTVFARNEDDAKEIVRHTYLTYPGLKSYEIVSAFEFDTGGTQNG